MFGRFSKSILDSGAFGIIYLQDKLAVFRQNRYCSSHDFLYSGKGLPWSIGQRAQKRILGT